MHSNGKNFPRIAVVIPCYRVSAKVLSVLALIGPEVKAIYVIDDACPEGTGSLVSEQCGDPRVRVIHHQTNRGVGAAVLTGYRAALDDAMDILVKVDGDGQMDPALIMDFACPILDGQADYTKGNRFYDPDGLSAMPRERLLGNAALSLINKWSSGYWNLFDPTNGYTAIHASVAARLDFSKISQRYFFESDMLFRLNLLRAVVVDVPMTAHYADETSNLRIARVVPEFSAGHMRNFLKRLFYSYYLRDMSVASIELPLGMLLFCFGFVYGSCSWLESIRTGVTSSAGTVMLSALPVILGVQLILAFLNYDISSIPRRPIQRRVGETSRLGIAEPEKANA